MDAEAAAILAGSIKVLAGSLVDAAGVFGVFVLGGLFLNAMFRK